jgi:2-dehydro-3-deoxygluconokinase
MLDVVTLGETMVVLSPARTGSLSYVGDFRRHFGGAESNFAIGLARLGHNSGWISRVGDDPFGGYIVNGIRGEGVDTSRVRVDSGAPTGVYFKEFHETRETKVYYYRSGSAASRMTVDDIDEDYIASAKFLHITGITPMLSSSAKEAMFKAIEIARKNGVKISFDPNIRRKLGTDQQWRKCLREIIGSVDVLLTGYEEAKIILQDGEDEELCSELLKMGPSVIGMKLGKEGCLVASEGYLKKIPGAKIERVVDTVGAGDGFDAGFISGLLRGYNLEGCGRLGNTVGAIVTTVVGDFEGLPTMREVKEFLGEESSIDR